MRAFPQFLDLKNPLHPSQATIVQCQPDAISPHTLHLNNHNFQARNIRPYIIELRYDSTGLTGWQKVYQAFPHFRKYIAKFLKAHLLYINMLLKFIVFNVFGCIGVYRGTWNSGLLGVYRGPWNSGLFDCLHSWFKNKEIKLDKMQIKLKSKI